MVERRQVDKKTASCLPACNRWAYPSLRLARLISDFANASLCYKTNVSSITCLRWVSGNQTFSNLARLETSLSYRYPYNALWRVANQSICACYKPYSVLHFVNIMLSGQIHFLHERWYVKWDGKISMVFKDHIQLHRSFHKNHLAQNSCLKYDYPCTDGTSIGSFWVMPGALIQNRQESLKAPVDICVESYTRLVVTSM